MILALLIFFIAAVFLMWQATVPLVLGIVLSAGSAGILLYIFIKNAHLSLTLQKSMKKYKAKWDFKLRKAKEGNYRQPLYK